MYHTVNYALGRYKRFETVDWQRVKRLVFVCDGNICRSAYAEARARSLAIGAISFGLTTKGGDKPPLLLLQSAAEAGLDLSDHRSRAINVLSTEDSDLVLAMEPTQVSRVLSLPYGGCQVTLLGLWCRHRRPHIEDPFGLGADYFRTCIRLIDEAIIEVASRVGMEADENLKANSAAAQVWCDGSRAR